MPTGSGLDASIGFAAEDTWGTEATADHFSEFNSETLSQTLAFLDGAGLRVGSKFQRVSRTQISTKTVAGDVVIEHATKGMGLLWKHALGSSATPTLVSGATAAFEQIHTPGGQWGLGMTVQVGRPEPSTGTVQPFTYRGCKVTKWEFDVKNGAIPTLTLSFDGVEEATDTALATPTYVSGAAVFTFQQVALKLGGTVATADGKTTVTGGIAVATTISEIDLTGETPMATDRYGLGNAGLKSEQLENDFPTITGKLSAEFNKSELYDKYTSNDTIALQLTLTGGEIETGQFYTLDFILPAVKLQSATPQVGGPDIVSMDSDIKAYSNEVDPPIQVRIVSDEDSL